MTPDDREEGTTKWTGNVTPNKPEAERRSETEEKKRSRGDERKSEAADPGKSEGPQGQRTR